MASEQDLSKTKISLELKVKKGTATPAEIARLKAIKGQLADPNAFTGTEDQRQARNALLSQRRSETNRQQNQLNIGKKAVEKDEGDAPGAYRLPGTRHAEEFQGLKPKTNPKSAATKKKSASLGDIFKAKNWKKTSKGDDDYSPAKRTYDTPFGAIDLDTSKEGMFDDSEPYDMGQKKGGRLKKASGKKAVKKNATRKRAALRGHRAELRGG